MQCARVGGAGDDNLNGGTGDDQYQITRGGGMDAVQDQDVSVNTDQVLYDLDIHHDQLWFTQSGNDLRISIIGTNDLVTIADWYLDNSNQIEEFTSGDGYTLLNSDVDQLVKAMAGLTPPASGELDLSPSMQTQLNPVLAASWQ